MVWHTVPSWAQALFPKRIWTMRQQSDKVYLTFDDGPVPEITDFVLTELQRRGMKATFFMVGDNVRKYPALAKEVLAEGHKIGNHTFNHLNGWQVPLKEYLSNIKLCDQVLEDLIDIKPRLFRPPYGLMKPAQAKVILREKDVVMWDVLSGDYDSKISAEKILKSIKTLTQPGSIVLFHDQEKTASILPKILPDYLDYILERNWNTSTL